TLKNGATYYTKYVSDTTIQLYQSILDYRTGINTVGFTTIGTSGIQKFVTEPKNKLTEIKVINGGSNYTNRKLRVTSSGISTSSNIIRFNGHGFNEGDLVVYSSTQNLISGLSTEKQYYVIKVDDNNFRLSDAGIGGTDKTNYLRKKYVKLESTGTGYQIFNYPEISLVVEYSSVGLGTTQFRGSITATPVVRGKIIDAYVYNSGSNYGSTILNYHKKPSISIKSGKDAQFVPIIANGKITDVSIQYSGSEYYSTPEILVVGDGKGALLKPIVTNNKITDVVVINSGYGYSSSKTYINIISSGSGAILDPQVRSLTVNTNKLFRDVNTTSSETNELLISSYNNLQYAVCGYSNLIKTEFSDNGLEHSKIIGWAYDGNPIYGAYGYSDPKNKNSSIKKLVPGYTSSLSNISNRPSEFPEGFFVEDYKFTNSGDLDRYNGRFCVTPEFPNGTYAYFSTFKIDQDNNIVGSFPYFIGNEYKSKYISENKFLNQSFDFNNSKLTRNTFPYKLNDRYADNDFITESNEIINQVTIVESVLSGSVNDFEIINEGDNYKVGDNLEFDDLDTDGGGLSAQVSELTGKEIININTSSVLYNNAVFTWSGKNVVNIKIEPYHDLSNLDYVSVSGLSTSLSSLNGFHKIGVTSYTSILIKDIPSSGIVTDIYVSNIPKNISIGSSVGIGTEILSIINIFESKNILRVGRGIVGASHTATSLVYFKPDTITIENPVTYFESFYNNTVYFNPNQSIGVGTTPGLGFNVLYNIGIQTNNTISIPSQTLYLPNHPFTNNQEVTLVKPSSSSAISVANTSGGTQFNLPIAGNTQKVYIIKKSQDHIGIVTQIGLTTTSSGLFFISNGSNDYGYYLQSNFKQVKGNIDKIVSTVSVSTSHGLKSEDTIGLVINPNLSVGIGTSTSIKVKRDANTGYILIDTIQFNSSGINTETNTITISQHNLNTGDKVKYSANTVASGLTTGFYYVYKVDNDKIKLSETFIDSALTSPPNTIDIFSTGGSSQNISKVNPNIKVTKNNNIVFDLSDSSLVDYNFKLFCDQEFKNEFVSTGSTNQFSLVGVGTIGISSTASLTLNYSDNLPNKLFYSLEKFGVISEPDKDTQNYSEINFVESFYNGSYTISGVGNTTFNVFLRNYPERLSYSKEECDLLKYTTSSTSTSGGISKIRLISSGNNYKKLPIFKKITSLNGTGAYVIPKSDTIGKVNEIRIVNEGFEYSSDKTLRPQALVPRFAFIKNSNTINNIFVTDGGKNYISPPNLVIINSETREKINSGLLVANLSSNTISSVLIDVPPTGLPETIVDVKSINNTNGIKIQNVKSSLTGIVTCVLVTPLSGFGQEPFSIGDKIFVEGIQIEEGSGEGLNSEDYGYQFFTVSNYLNANTTTPRQLEFSVSGFTTNPGIAKSVENFYGTIINYKNYPKFEVIQDFSNFVIGELLEVKYQNQFIEEDLLITESNKNYIKIKGSYDLRENQIIRGTQSGSIATIEKITKSSGQFVVNYSLTKKIGWQDNIGNLNDDIQVVSDNDYYQRLAYSVKSTKEWNEIVSPVNSLLHPSGLKNFSNTEIIETTGIGTVSSEEYIYSFYDIINENRVDTIYNYDLVNDIDTVGNNSLFLKFKNKKLTDYVECTSNRALEIDDISSQFSTRDSSLTALSSKVDEINKSRKYNHYLVQISSEDYSQTQFNEIIVLNDDFETFTLEKGSLSTGDYNQTGYNANQIGDLYGYIDEFGSCYLKFDPKDPYNTIYNIKFVNTAFTNYLTGIGSTSIGFVSLTGITSTVSVGSTAVIESKNIGNIESIHSQVHIIDNVTNEMNYVEVYVDHDGTDTNIAEFYFDSDDGLSSNFIGSFGASVSNGVLSLKYTNNTSNSVTIRSKNVGFGTTSIGIGTYRFKQSGQIDDTENTVRYDSLYQNVSLASTIFSFDTNIFTSVKSVIRVSIGKTSALHQLMIIANPTEIYTTQYPFLSIGSTSGIGTFGGELSGSVASIKFYPDPSLTGTFEVLSFNQNFYKENDYINTPPDLEYSNVSETIQVKKYYGINLDEIDRLNFPLNYKNTPIFTKTFNPSNSSILNLSTGEFNITNHFFSTGEELIYRPNSTFIGVAASSVGIGLTMNYVGVVTNILPEVVYAIKISNDKFKLSTRKEYASAGIYVTFTSTGSGNSHELEMSKKNEKSIITVNNIIQSPITYSLLDYTINNGTQIGASSTIIGLSGISSILIGDILKIDNEYMKVTNVGVGTSRSGPISFGGTFPLVSVTRGFFGSISTTHSNLGIASVYRGSFNIVKNDIYFVDPPEGSLEDQILSDLDNLPESRAYFSGRVFLKSDYTSNRVYDDISEKFDGKTQTYTLTVGGANTVGLGTSGGNGIVIINGIYQTPTTANNVNNNFKILENNITGISSIVFSGITSSNGSTYISQSDVNMNELPRGGLIVSLGSTPGLGYAPLVGASVTAIVSGGSIISIGIGTTGNWGSGYKNPVSIAVTESGHSGLSATITATVGAGGTLSFTVVNGGSGYTNPIINISPPNYSNLSVIGVSRLGIGQTTESGSGLLLDIEVGSSSTTGIGSTLFEVVDFKVNRNGYGFKKGDVVKVVGLVTAYGLNQPISEFQLTVLDTYTDKFAAWQFGELDYIDSIENYQNGSRRTFPLYYNSQLLSFEKNSNNADSQLIDFDSLLVIFINGVLQQPGVSYQFEGGTSFTFTTAPKPEDNISIYFYRGSSVDSKIVDVNETIKPGDDIQVFSNNNQLDTTVTQNSRILSSIVSSSVIETNLYNGQGIDEENKKPLAWTKQKSDKLINGNLVSKERDSIETQIYPTAKIIKNVSPSDTEIFVDNAQFFNYENEVSINFDALMVAEPQNVVSAGVTAVVSSSGTIQSLLINNSGSGYSGSTISLSISAPPRIGTGIGTVGTATASIVNGSLSTITITNPGFGYNQSNPPQVLVPSPEPVYENIQDITSIQGSFGNVVGIATTVGIGTNLAIKFTLSSVTGLQVGYPIYIFNTKVGSGVTSIVNSNSNIVGIGTSYLDNVYYISAVSSSVGIITCNIHSNSSVVGIATTGSLCGNFSWGRLYGSISRSPSPISINVSGFTVNSGLSSFPTIQRRGYGLRNIGSIKKAL
ncbi:MAG: Prochlorococcus phage, partial [Actinomycetota bacterium]